MNEKKEGRDINIYKTESAFKEPILGKLRLIYT